MATTTKAKRVKKVMVEATTLPGGKKVAVKGKVVVTGSKVAVVPVKVPDTVKLESDLVARYPQARIVPGSYRLAGAKDGFTAKRSVLIECCQCDKQRRVATSDLFQTKTCSDECRKLAKKATKEAAKEAAK